MTNGQVKFQRVNWGLIKERADKRYQEIQDAITRKDTTVIEGLICASLFAEPARYTRPVYQYTTTGVCFFEVNEHQFEVAALYNMRPDEGTNAITKMYDVCVVLHWGDELDILPGTWLFGASDDDDFGPGLPVHAEFYNAAKKYLKEHF